MCALSLSDLCVSRDMFLFQEIRPFAGSCPSASELLALWEQVSREPLATAKSCVSVCMRVFQPQVGSKRALCYVAISLTLHPHWLFVWHSQRAQIEPHSQPPCPQPSSKTGLCRVVCVVIAAVDKQTVPCVHRNPLPSFPGPTTLVYVKEFWLVALFPRLPLNSRCTVI